MTRRLNPSHRNIVWAAVATGNMASKTANITTGAAILANRQPRQSINANYKGAKLIKTIDELARDPVQMKLLQRCRLEMIITELISQKMAEQGLNAEQVSGKMTYDWFWLTRILQDASTLRVDELSDIFFTLGLSLDITVRPLTLSPTGVKDEQV